MDLSQLPVAPVRWIYPFLLRRWDGGAVKIAGTVAEGDEVAGFRVIHFPGHAPGLIGLWRESDRLALVSDVVYFVDSARLQPLPEGEASVPHPAWAWDHAKAKESVRKLAALEPAVVGAGHGEPLRGENLRATLERAAEQLLSRAGLGAAGWHSFRLLMIGTYASAALICAASLLVGRAVLALAGRSARGRGWSPRSASARCSP